MYLDRSPSICPTRALTSSGRGESATQLQLVKTRSTVTELFLYSRHSSKAQIKSMPLFNRSTSTAAASSTDIELANRGAVRGGGAYLLQILTRYNLTKDLVKSFSSQLQPATQKPSIDTTSVNIPSIPPLYATATPPSPSLPQSALL